MSTRADPTDDPGDAASLAAYSSALVDAVAAALADWVVRAVEQRWISWQQKDLPRSIRAAAEAAGEQALGEVLPRLSALVATDVDAQRTNPLSIIRAAVIYPTRVLADAGVPPVRRDAEAERLFPDDVYDLTPASFSDVGPSVHEPGLVWGAAKAHVVLRRRGQS